MDWRSQLDAARAQYEDVFQIEKQNAPTDHAIHPFPDLQHVYATSLFRPLYNGPILRPLSMGEFMQNDIVNPTAGKVNVRGSIKVEEAVAGIEFLESYFNDFVVQAVMLRNNALAKPSVSNHTSTPSNYLAYVQKQKLLSKDLSIGMDKFQFERLDAVVCSSTNSSDKQGLDYVMQLKQSLERRCQVLREEIAGTEVLLEYLATEVAEIVAAPKDYSCKLDYIRPNWSDMIDLQKSAYTTNRCRNFEIYMELQSLPVCQQVYNFLQSPVKLCNNILCISNYQFEPGEFITIMEYVTNNVKLKSKIHQLIINDCSNAFRNVATDIADDEQATHNHHDDQGSEEDDGQLEENSVEGEDVGGMLEDYVMFAQCVVKLSNLQVLSLKGNCITDDGLISFVTTLMTHSHLKQKEKYNNQAQYYASLIKNRTSGNMHSLEMMERMCLGAESSMPPLTTIRLDNNAVSDVGCKVMCNALFRVNPRGIESDIDDDKAFHSSMLPFPSLRVLSLASNPICNRGLYYLLRSLLNTTRRAYKYLPKPTVVKRRGHAQSHGARRHPGHFAPLGTHDLDDDSSDEEGVNAEAVFNSTAYDTDGESVDGRSVQSSGGGELQRINILNIRRKSLLATLDIPNEPRIESCYASDMEAFQRLSDARPEMSRGKRLIVTVMHRVRAKLFAVNCFTNMWKNKYILNNKITTLDLSNCGLTAPYATKLLYVVCKENKNIHHLNISHNNLGSDSSGGCADIAELISKDCEICTLDIRNCNVSSGGVEVLVRKTHAHGPSDTSLSPGLSYLDMSHNSIGPTGVNWIASRLVDEFFLDRCRVVLSMASQTAAGTTVKPAFYDETDDDKEDVNRQFMSIKQQHLDINAFVDEDIDDDDDDVEEEESYQELDDDDDDDGVGEGEGEGEGADEGGRNDDESED